MEENNEFVSKNEIISLFLGFPEEHIYTVNFVPEHIEKNTSIKLSKYTIINDDEVFSYE